VAQVRLYRTYDAHSTLLGAGTLIVENLVPREIPDRWCTPFIGVLNVLGGDGAPTRARRAGRDSWPAKRRARTPSASADGA
jgi:kynurenine formamidase